MAITKATGPVLGNYTVGTENVTLGETALDSVQSGGEQQIFVVQIMVLQLQLVIET